MPSEMFSHLILVCCHATYRGDDPNSEASWILQDFQKSDSPTGKIGEHHTFNAHIQVGMSLTANDPAALLIFSGGKTQSQVNLTEADSYLQAMLDANKSNEPRCFDKTRCDVENEATDSFQNLLFSILRFRKLTGSYPGRVTVVTHAFKERRFLELHGPAIKYPAQCLRVLGINPPFTLAELHDVQKGEHLRGYGVFSKDLYGVRQPLKDKRIARGWASETYDILAGGLEEGVQVLLSWKGGESGKDVLDKKLPWEMK